MSQKQGRFWLTFWDGRPLGKTLDEQLNDQQALFVRYYLVSLNASDAALKAGYSKANAGVIGHQLLKHPIISAEIKRRQKARAKRLEINGENILRELARIGFADVRAYVSVTDDGEIRVKATDEMDDDAAAAVQEISQTTTEARGGKRGEIEITTKNRKVKLHDKIRALDLMGRHVGLWKDGIDLGQPITIRMAYDPTSTKGKADGSAGKKAGEEDNAASSPGPEAEGPTD